MAYMAKIIVFFFAICLVVDAYKLDMCRAKPPVKEDFELLKIAGRWYEFARFPNIFQYFYKERCNTQFMTVEGNGLRFSTSFINETSNERVKFEGKMTNEPDYPGKVQVTMPSVGFADTFSIVDAKYDDYVIFYFCDTLAYFRIEMAWILTREAQLSDDRKKNLLEKLKSLKIDTERLEFECHNNC